MTRILSAVLLMLAAMPCAAQPTVGLARQAIAAHIDSGRADRLAIRDFEKTQGEAQNLPGMSIYIFRFSANVEALVDLRYNRGDSMSSLREDINSEPLTKPVCPPGVSCYQIGSGPVT